MEFKVNLYDTVKLMTSSDCNDRFRAEYFQAKIRLDELNSYLAKYDSGILTLDPPKKVSTLKQQVAIMADYVKILEQRAINEDIELTLYIGEKTVLLKKPTGEWLDNINEKAERARNQLYEIQNLIKSLSDGGDYDVKKLI